MANSHEENEGGFLNFTLGRAETSKENCSDSRSAVVDNENEDKC